MKRKGIRILLCLLITAGLAAGCSGKKEAAENGDELLDIRISAIMTVSWAPVYVAETQGIFAKHGLKAEFVTPGGPKGFQATHAGDCDFCMLSQEPLLIAQDQGIRSTIIGTMLNSRVYGIIAPPEITSVSQLKGSPIYGSDPGSAPYTFTCNILEEAGLNPAKDVTFVQMDLNAAIMAMDNGEIQAAFINMSKLPELKDIDVNILVDTTSEADRLKYLGNQEFPAEMICTTEKYAKENPEVCQKVMDSIIDAQKWIQEHNDEEVAAALAKDFTAIDQDILAEEVATMRDVFKTDCFISEAGENAVVQMGLDTGLIKRKIPYSEIVDMTFVNNYSK